MELRSDSFCANPAMRTQWYVVADAADVARSPVAVTLLGDRFVLWRGTDGEIRAASGRCPHREAPLLTSPNGHAGTIGPDTDPVVAPVTVESLDADFTGYQ